jgi:glyoxylase-like metal-dependent hydrolase (beta-lactamase superfamily II)
MTLLSRRAFLVESASCSAHLALAAAVMPRALRESWTRSDAGLVVAREPFGELKEIAPRVWAMISNPLGGDSTTVSNGGLIAGSSGVLAIEGFNKPEGAAWIAGKARELTGKWPTHVVLTHYHGDHANGIAGYVTADAHPAVRATGATRDLVLERNKPTDQTRAALGDATMLDPSAATTLDLGGRTVRIVPRSGHTVSDCSVELDDPDVVFCGDLVWNAMFPNYVDAVPSRLSRDARTLRRKGGKTQYVPGHGAMANDADLGRYLAMIDEVEKAARAAHAQGTPAATAGAAFQLPASLGEWVLFNKVFFERAFTAWYRELGG